MEKQSAGNIAQVIGAVVDEYFEEEKDIPKIYEALEVTLPDGHKIVLECQQDIGENFVRTIAMDGTDGLYRGLKVINLLWLLRWV